MGINGEGLYTDSVGKQARKLCNKQPAGGTGTPFFHRLRPPDELHRNSVISGAQVRGGETRQDYKDPRCFPPGSSLVRSPVPTLRFIGVYPLLWPRSLIPRLTLDSV
uniref:Uncharacterized protein n=1 Tax=Edwardsiella piscicida TaxID=1263550 RepID=A0A8F5V6V1_EDWPI|nr:hypothetical protein [Edwardsiella piscicida]